MQTSVFFFQNKTDTATLWSTHLQHNPVYFGKRHICVYLIARHKQDNCQEHIYKTNVCTSEWSLLTKKFKLQTFWDTHLSRANLNCLTHVLGVYSKTTWNSEKREIGRRCKKKSEGKSWNGFMYILCVYQNGRQEILERERLGGVAEKTKNEDGRSGAIAKYAYRRWGGAWSARQSGVLQWIVVSYSELQCLAVSCRALQYTVGCCSVL